MGRRTTMNRIAVVKELVKIAKEINSSYAIDLEEAYSVTEDLKNALNIINNLKKSNLDRDMMKWWSVVETNLRKTLHSLEEAMRWEERLSRSI